MIYLQRFEYKETCEEWQYKWCEPFWDEVIAKGYTKGPQKEDGEDNEGKAQEPSNVDEEEWKRELGLGHRAGKRSRSPWHASAAPRGSFALQEEWEY